MKVRLVNLALIETSLLYLRKFLLISITTASLTQQKQGGFYHNRVNISHTWFKGQASKHTTVNWNQVSYDRRSCGRNFKQLRIEAWKSQDFNGVWTRDLALPVRRSNQLSYEATDVGSRSFVSSNEPVKNGCEVIYEMFHTLNCGYEINTQLLKIASTTAMIIAHLISYPQFNIWNISYITSHVNWNICKKTGEQLTALFLSFKLVVYAHDVVYWHE